MLSDKLAMHIGVVEMLKRFKLHFKLLFSAVECENASQNNDCRHFMSCKVVTATGDAVW